MPFRASVEMDEKFQHTINKKLELSNGLKMSSPPGGAPLTAQSINAQDPLSWCLKLINRFCHFLSASPSSGQTVSFAHFFPPVRDVRDKSVECTVQFKIGQSTGNFRPSADTPRTLVVAVGFSLR